MLLNGAIAGSEIVALLTTDSSGLARPRYQVCPPPFGGTSPLTLCTVSWPSPGASPLIASHPLPCRAVGAHDPDQIEPYLEPSRDEALRAGSREGRAVQDRLLPGSLVQ